ncbi:hypothetical protein E2C01_085144 [Portunus trituberculatus]|uniref:Uncharacterized protein n=1 Tax=Portunus trituberculatus TaxID=210409 RepID=A0A5B7IX51_PORTR|nr:hypothetical protein [Portunus trituberculatus]
MGRGTEGGGRRREGREGEGGEGGEETKYQTETWRQFQNPTRSPRVTPAMGEPWAKTPAG